MRFHNELSRFRKICKECLSEEYIEISYGTHNHYMADVCIDRDCVMCGYSWRVIYNPNLIIGLYKNSSNEEYGKMINRIL